MPTVERTERKILAVEGIGVRILRPNGRKAQRNLDGLPRYSFEKALGDRRTVTDWKRLRFNRLYPDFDVEVLDSPGRNARSMHGATSLRKARDAYGAK